jgi:hypothetical protein
MSLKGDVRDDELFHILENFFCFLYKHLVRFQGTQAHVVLPSPPKKKKKGFGGKLVPVGMMMMG